METVPLADAQTRFVELIDRVRTTGETITLTDHGRPVVDLAPTRAEEPAQKMTKAEAIEAIERMREELPVMEPGECRRLIEEGRDEHDLAVIRRMDNAAARTGA